MGSYSRRGLKKKNKRSKSMKKVHDLKRKYVLLDHSYCQSVELDSRPESQTIEEVPRKSKDSHEMKMSSLECDSDNKLNKSLNNTVDVADIKAPTEHSQNPPEDTVNENLQNSFISEKEYDRILNHQLHVEVEKDNPFKSNISGNRIVDLGYVLDWALCLQTEHSKICTCGRLVFYKEIRDGFFSTIYFKCTMCNKRVIRTTAPKSKTSNDLDEHPLNIAAVWGTLSTGSSHNQMEELCSVLDIPNLSFRKFHKIENKLSNVWQDNSVEEMSKAGKEENAIAKEKGHVDADGIPFISVYVDGGWSKRSYGHNYDAASGAAVIIGKETKKVLYLGVRNKFCFICAKAFNMQLKPKHHICFRNWTGSSSAMEADIIVEGFQQSINMHGVRYKYFTADGDSRTFADLKTKVNYGTSIVKSECKNHAIKNYSKHLYTLREDKRVDSSKKFLTIVTIKKLTNIAKFQIYYNNRHGTTEQLKEDIYNGPYHIFGQHDKCKDYYCTEKSNNNMVPQMKILGLFQGIEGICENLVKKANALYNDDTNNRAELFMSLLAKYNAGKRLNLIMRGSFQTRCHLASLQYNKGPDWQGSVWKHIVKKSPGRTFTKMLRRKKYIRQYKSRYEKLKCRKSLFSTQCILRKGQNHDYGKNAEDAEWSEDDMRKECDRVIEKMQVTVEQRDYILKNSIGQFGNIFYEAERSNRLTASLFGKIVKRRPWTPCHTDVKLILYPANFFSDAIEYGKIHEKIAIQRFEILTGIKVVPSGLFVDLIYGFLGASPDGLVSDDGIIEVKCLYSVSKSGLTLKDAAKSGKICLELVNNLLSLKRQHNYYYQIQGQLNISKRDYCYFIVYVDDKTDLFIEKIYRDIVVWDTKMVPKLIKFYKENVAPEIVRRRVHKGLKCIDSPYIQSQIKSRANIVRQQ